MLTCTSRPRSLEFKIADVEEERTQLLADARAQNSTAVRAWSAVYAGTTISIGWHTTTIIHELKGPVSIELRETDEDVTFVAVHQVTGTVDRLETEEVSPDDLLTGLQRGDAAKIELSTFSPRKRTWALSAYYTGHVQLASNCARSAASASQSPATKLPTASAVSSLVDECRRTSIHMRITLASVIKGTT